MVALIIKIMKYILKLNEQKVQEAKKSMHVSYKGILSITLTNEGTKEFPSFRIHDITNSIIDLGAWDCDRILQEAEKVGYNVPSYFNVQCTCTGEKSTNFNVEKSLRYLIMKNPVGLISRITGFKVIRINELV